MAKTVIHVVGTGTIGEPLIGLLTHYQKDLGIDEVTFNKRTPLKTDRSKAVYVQTQAGYSVLLSPADPDGFLGALEKL